MNRFNKAEQKYQRLAIPGILRILACFQLLVFILAHFQGESSAFLEAISLSIAKVLDGEVWRLLTFIFIPRTFSLIWILIAVLFMWFINDGLENAWGAFRLNAYAFGTMICTIVGCFITYFLFGISFFPVSDVIFHAAFLAFAVIYPNQVIQFMLVLPIKIKYVALLDVAVVALIILRDPIHNAIPYAFAFVPFAIFAGPIFLQYAQHSATTAERRARFQAASEPETDSFHKCYACGVTENDDPNLEFRVAADGEEYCLPCLKEKKAAEQANS
ncbi:MAG: hypothetical protein AAF591_11250 [Verrucomicrobiota bacterium]